MKHFIKELKLLKINQLKKFNFKCNYIKNNIIQTKNFMTQKCFKINIRNPSNKLKT